MEGSRFISEQPKYYDSNKIDKLSEICIDKADSEISRAAIIWYSIFAVIPMIILVILFSI